MSFHLCRWTQTWLQPILLRKLVNIYYFLLYVIKLAKLIYANLICGMLKFQTVEAHAQQGASYRLGHICARGHVGLAVVVATVFHRELPVTMRSVLATPAWQPMVADASALEALLIKFAWESKVICYMFDVGSLGRMNE